MHIDTAVHGDIRHLEKSEKSFLEAFWVHGDIRHLEKPNYKHSMKILVHGDIRHLEKTWFDGSDANLVHGDIRHLEKANGASATVAQALSTIADNLDILKVFFDDVGDGFFLNGVCRHELPK